MSLRSLVRRTAAIMSLVIALSACAQVKGAEPPVISGLPGADVSATRVSGQVDDAPRGRDAWFELLALAPYPFTAELPPYSATPLDGTYVRVDPRPGERAPCRRCPPYPPEGGTWRLQLDRGVFRVLHERTAWRSLGSFTLNGERITFFNDPHCIEARGSYTWGLEAGALRLQVVEDLCGKDLRARGLAAQLWESCQPPSAEAAISDHWAKPAGCDSY